ncbi:hypothetical protein PHYBOEH_008459 [Phytophthora boehmeriae]|uniref:Uncharacterized protein n=1 Tax=Phytophthora boehmeriae TaxID=109152 RepID=A0A8T1VZK8_9STRA|nr:hypothetical protein PHYBOEH_008459 [Phytophthora boehmeriae]
MRVGHSYKDAVKHVDGDNLVHVHFHRETLLDTLCSMMYEEVLDEVPWTRFVADMYFVQAAVNLHNLVSNGKHPEPWLELDEEEDDEVLIYGPSPSCTDDDDSKDPEFKRHGAEAGADDDNEAESGQEVAEVEVLESLSKPKAKEKRKRPDDDSSLPSKKLRNSRRPTKLALKAYTDLDQNDVQCMVNYQEVVPVDEDGDPFGNQLSWVQLFADRTKVLYFHKASELNSKVKESRAE